MHKQDLQVGELQRGSMQRLEDADTALAGPPHGPTMPRTATRFVLLCRVAGIDHGPRTPEAYGRIWTSS